jgi:hypothetical protein
MKLGEGLSVLQKLDLSLQEMLCMPTKALNQLAGEAQLTTAELAELKVWLCLSPQSPVGRNIPWVQKFLRELANVRRLNEGEQRIAKRHRRCGGRKSSTWTIC